MSILERANGIFASVAKMLDLFFDYLFGTAPGGSDSRTKIRIGELEETLRPGVALEDSGYGKAPALRFIKRFSWAPAFGEFFIYPEEEPNPHMLIVGMSGYGKSTLCKALILEICRAGKKIMVFDVHNEHAPAIKCAGGKSLNALNAGINIFALDGMTVADRISDLVALFTDVYGLGTIQSAVLAPCLWYTYRKAGATSKTANVIKKTPVISDLIDELSVFMKLSKNATERQGLHSMRSKLLPLNNPAFNSNFIALEDLKSTVLSFSLAKLKNKEARAIYINELLKRLYVSMKDNEKERGIRYYIMMDEAQFLIGNGSSAGELIRKLIEEGRKYGVGLIVATHSANSLDRQIVANASTFVSFYSREPEEVEYVANLLGGGHRDTVDMIKSRMMGLGKHEAFVMKSGLETPSIVKTLAATEVAMMLEQFGATEEERMEELCGNLVTFAIKPVTAAGILEQFGEEAGTCLDGLVAKGKISTMVWKEKDREELWYMAERGNLSIQHEVNVKKISEGLTALGVRNTVTDGGTGKPDIIAFAHGWNAAIEYETGSKQDSVTSDMLSRRVRTYRKVYVFVAEEQYERYVRLHKRENIDILKPDELGKIVAEFDAQQNSFKESPP